ncbi:glycosyltransferase family 4 protein [Streptomyces radicis]|uniref:D-inositol 3-phosphate glycosyltransferase n=1 Tax=Streptomyces radicis TaxID=1750517 RepID=A0A3A9W0S1_9ACTN|nr:glycosyltransferase family 4 protein [Streptomyces radicis]RKN06469.1 glycosyltransferase family 4 protein [Streptomyces radicis]RKN20272.1 glycosyltransferase family 4 protein [Streptomyces radicis]
MKISFLLHNAYGIGGTIKTTFNLAGALAERHEVEIISVHRHREEPNFTLDTKVRLRALTDQRVEKDHPLRQRAAKVFPASEYRYDQYSELTDQRIEECLTGLTSDVVIGTRPGLNVHLALQGPRGAALVGQEHLTLDGHPPALRNALRAVYPRLDAITTVTRADADAYRRKMRMPGVRVTALPNSVPEPRLAPADGEGRIVIAAGRLVRSKRHDVLIRAFARVVAERPDWRLRIYGKGDEHDRLRALIEELGLYNHVHLMGAYSPIEAEWVKGSIAAVTSSFEPFGMTIVEAMRCGLPVVSTNCPYGPAEIIEDGVDGRLVPVGDEETLAGALLDLMRDDALRHRMGAAALARSRRYGPGPIVEQAEELFDDLLRSKTTRGRITGAFRRRASVHAIKDAALTLAFAPLRTLRKVKR